MPKGVGPKPLGPLERAMNILNKFPTQGFLELDQDLMLIVGNTLHVPPWNYNSYRQTKWAYIFQISK